MEAPLRQASTINLQHLVRFLVNLQVGIRKFSMYSGSHPIIPEMITALTAQCQALLETTDALQIGVTKEEVLYQGAPVGKTNPVIGELARSLHQVNLVGITFRRELAPPDVRRFLELLADFRALLSAEGERALERFGAETPAIGLQFVRFGRAVKDRDDSTTTDQEAVESGTSDVWRGLVARLMAEDLPEESKLALQAGVDGGLDVEQLAAAINLMVRPQSAGAQSYERAIVSFLHEQAKGASSADHRAKVNQQLGVLMAKLSPDVRQQIFRMSLEPAPDQTVPVESLLESMPTPLLLEVLNQIQVGNKDISLPMFSLLKKFVSLADSDSTLMASLQAKIEGHKELVEELLVKRVDRVFYPAQYRALLDQEFAEHTVSGGMSDRPANCLDEAEVNQHLALILLEMLEAPLLSEQQYAHTVTSLKTLLAGGLHERTQSILTDTMAILASRYAGAPESQREFFRQQIQNFFHPELITHLLQPAEAGNEERRKEALARLMEVVGPGIIPLLLDTLEVEEKIAVRKRLLVLLRECGAAVVPFALQRLQHPQWFVVRNMLLLLRELHAAGAEAEIARCAGHASPKVRLTALQTLSELGSTTDVYFQALEQALGDDDPKVFRAAVSSIVSSADPRAAALAYRTLTEDPSAERRARQVAVLRAIGQVGTAALIPLLMTIRQRYALRFWTWQRTRAVRVAAKHALDTIRSRQG
ncbi:MAG: HEAT repeat domain-containing protein [Nitrospirae bacterium]|nr:HEAT repeat domain-containing protein [Nitrospirota bacterium]